MLAPVITTVRRATLAESGGDASCIAIDFTNPATGGTTIAVFRDGAMLQTTGITSPALIHSVTKDISYAWQLGQTDGTSDPSQAPKSNSVSYTRTQTAPTSAPTGLVHTMVAQEGDQVKHTLKFFPVPDSANGGSAIQYYTIIESGGHVTTTASISPLGTDGKLSAEWVYPGSWHANFRVAAHNNDGDGVFARTDTLPVAPTAVTAIAVNYGFVFTWAYTPTYQDEQNLVFKATASPGGRVITLGASGDLVAAMPDQFLTPGTSYSFTIAGTNLVGVGAASAGTPAVLYSGTNVQIPSAPQNLNAVALANLLVKVTWDAPVTTGGMPITHYDLEQYFYDGSATTTTQVAATAREYIISDLTEGKVVHIGMIARNILGKTMGDQPAHIAGVVTAVVVLPPMAPTGLTAVFKRRTLQGDVVAQFTFTDPTAGERLPVSAYCIEVTPALSTGNIYIGKSGDTVSVGEASSPGWPVANFVADTAYTFRIAGYNAGGIGEFSALTAEVPFTLVEATTVPAVPAFVSVTPNGSNFDIVLSYAGVATADPHHYDVEILHDGTVTYSDWRFAGLTFTTTPSDLPLSPDGNPLYSMRVRAINQIGVSEWSALFPVTYEGTALEYTDDVLPKITSVVMGHRAALVTFTPREVGKKGGVPSSDTLYYKVEAGCPEASMKCVSYGLRSPILVAGLQPNYPYQFLVRVGIASSVDDQGGFGLNKKLFSDAATAISPEAVALPAPKVVAFRMSFNGTTAKFNRATVFSQIKKYLGLAGFSVSVTSGVSGQAGDEVSTPWLDFKPVHSAPLAGTTPKWGMCNHPTLGFFLRAYTGATLFDADVDSLGNHFTGEGKIYWVPPASSTSEFEVYFFADGITGECGLFILEGAPAAGSLNSIDWRLICSIVGTTLEVPMSAMQSELAHPYFGVLTSYGLSVPWVKVMPGVWDTPVNLAVAQKGAVVLSVVTPLGGTAAQAYATLRPTGSVFGQSLSDLYAVPNTPEQIPWAMTRANNVKVATAFGWDDWAMFGDLIVLPQPVSATGAVYALPRLALPCPVGGPTIVDPLSA